MKKTWHYKRTQRIEQMERCDTKLPRFQLFIKRIAISSWWVHLFILYSVFSLCLVIIFALTPTLPHGNISTPAFFWLRFSIHWLSFSILLLSACLCHSIWSQFIVDRIYLGYAFFFFFSHFADLCLFIIIFRSFTLNVILYWGVCLTFDIFAFCLFPLHFVSLFSFFYTIY